MLRRPLLPLLLLLAVWLATPLPLAASRSITIRSFDVDLVIRPDGAVVVTERIRLAFEDSWNGFVRTLPLRYRTLHGFGYRLRMEVETVTDERGSPLRYEESRERDSRALKIWVPGAENATRTVVLRYRAHNALRFFDADDPAGARDELYWNITGDEWEMPIQAASARIFLPTGASGVQSVAFSGVHGSTDQAAHVETVDGLVTVRATRDFAPGEGLTVAVGWAPGLVERPGTVSRIGGFFRSNGIFLLPILTLIAMLRLWSTRGRDPAARSVAVHYSPPEGMTPAELGTLVDHSADLRDITATLVDLAVRGFLTIEEKTESRLLGLGSSTEYIFHLRRTGGSWEDLQRYEHLLLKALFGRRPVASSERSPLGAAANPSTGTASPSAGPPLGKVLAHAIVTATSGSDTAPPGVRRTTVSVSELQNAFYKHLNGIRSGIYARLVERGYYLHRPDHVKAQYVVLGLLLGAAIVGGGLMAGDLLWLEPVPVGIAGGLTGLIIAAFGLFMPARTDRGARAREAALGFREFLGRVESDRFHRMILSPAQFEQFLPHAMALGVEERWAAAFESLYREPPEWYRGGSGREFRTHSFVRSLNTMSSSTSSAMTSQPSSRSSGGSGLSGGSSGGGFGGGGGRGLKNA